VAVLRSEPLDWRYASRQAPQTRFEA
jgi:hypothetical protein